MKKPSVTANIKLELELEGATLLYEMEAWTTKVENIKNFQASEI